MDFQFAGSEDSDFVAVAEFFVIFEYKLNVIANCLFTSIKQADFGCPKHP